MKKPVRPSRVPRFARLRDGLVVGLANHTLLIAKDGTERPIDDSAAPIRNDKSAVAGVVLVFRDVTERREQEHSLSDALKYSQSIIATLREPFLALDMELRIRTANDAYYRVFQTAKGETEGKSFWEIEDGQWDVAGLRQKLETLSNDHSPITDLEIAKTFSKLGHRVMVLNASRFVSLNNFPQSILVAIDDVTDRRQLQRSRLQAEILADQHRRKDEFLAMLSHELRNPLAPIQNAIHILRLKPDDDPIQRQARQIIERQVGQLTALVNDLLEVSRITTGRIHLRLEHVVLQGIVERAVEAAMPVIEARKLALHVSVPEPLIWLNADSHRIEQVIVNLLNNAAKYTPDGGSIWLTVEAQGAEAVIRVRDKGIGIPPDLLPRIFDLFTQADRSLDRAQGGLGIGLALVERLVVMHGGHVTAKSKVGQGSEFIVRVPVAQPPPDKGAASRGAVPAVGASALRILVVDDNIDAAGTLATLLRPSDTTFARFATARKRSKPRRPTSPT